MSGVNEPGDAQPRDAAITGRPRADDDDIEESLHEALNDLEQMLERHEGPRDERARAAPDDDEQSYSIPLLDEVVIPGKSMPVPRVTAAGRGEQTDLLADEPALRRRLATRLASEIEVIVQDRMEAAMEAARVQITQQVRNHIDIMLPEIVDEFMRIKQHDDE
jgi:hypothetical protein